MGDLMNKYAFLLLILLAGCAAGPGPSRATVQDSAAADLSALRSPSCGARIYVVAALTSGAFGVDIPSNVYIDGVVVDAVSHKSEISVIDVAPGRVEISWLPAGQKAGDAIAEPQVINLSPMQAAFVELEARTSPTFGIIGAIVDPQRARTMIRETTSHQDFVGKPVVFHRFAPGCS